MILGLVPGTEVLLWLGAVRKWGQFYNWTFIILFERWKERYGAKAVIGKEVAVSPERWKTVMFGHFCGLYNIDKWLINQQKL